MEKSIINRQIDRKALIRMARIGVIILFFSSFFVFGSSAANSYSESVRLNIDRASKRANLKEVICEVKKQTEFDFLYDKEIEKLYKDVGTVVIDNGTIEEVLNQVFKDSEIQYLIVDKTIVLTQKTSVETRAQQQNRTISGTVKDKDGLALTGVTVIVKGTKQGTATDLQGEYSIKLPEGSNVISFSYIGYIPLEIEVNANQQTVDVVMEEDSQILKEVVVTALGIKREQRALGYATQKISGNDIVRSNAANIASSLSGKIAGVNINNANQLEGGSSRIVIRGNNAIQGNNQPLIVIDGMPLENKPTVTISDVENGGTSEKMDIVRDYGSGLNFINNYDIEDINILKGPAAAALYGARGANGVILITTKKGAKTEGLGIDYSFTSKIINPYRFREQQQEYGYGGLQYPMYSANIEYEKDAAGNYLYPRNTWGNPRWDAVYGTMPNGYATYELFSWHAYSMSWGRPLDGTPIKWWDGVMRPHVADPDYERFYYSNGHTNTHNLSFSNGGEFGTVRVGITRDDHDAVIRNSDYNRTVVTLGSNMNISPKVKAEIYGTYTNYFRHNVVEIGNDAQSAVKSFYIFPTDYKPWLDLATYKNPDGSRRLTNNTYGDGGQGQQVYWNLLENSYDYKRDQLLGSVKLVYNPLSWLSISAQMGIDFHTDEYIDKRKPIDVDGLEQGYYQHKLGKESVVNADFIATAKKDNLFIEKFNSSFSLGTTRWDRRYYQMGGETTNDKWFKDSYLYTFGNIDLSHQNGVYTKEQLPFEDILNKRINSVYGFLDLSYGDFVYLQATGRNDWSSTLPLNNNSYFYPSASLSFVPTSLMKTLPLWVNFGKIRLAYASAATDADPYQVVPTYKSGSYGGFSTIELPRTIPPQDLKPQRANSYELGLETALFDSRFRLDFTFYRTLSYNQIMAAPVATSSGFNRVRFNTGEMENKGIEFFTGYEFVRNNDWNWKVGLNLGKNNNKLLSMSEGVKVFEIGNIFSTSGPTVQVEVGDSYGNIYGWDYARNEKGQKIIDVVYDKNDPTKIAGTKYRTTENRVKLGNITPDVIGGLNTTLNWKDFSLYALAGFSFGGDVWSGTYAASLSSGLSPSTLLERNGGGLPYTYPDGTKANHGVILDGVLEDGTPNTYVVHYIWKYAQSTAWGESGKTLNAPSILRNDWIKMNEITLTYNVPKDIVKRTKVFRSLGLMISGRDLFYIYSSLPDRLNPEALSNSAGNAQGLEFGALPGMRTFSFTLKAGF